MCPRFFNILADNDVREGLKTYSDWPTFPQLYTDGELVGGLDIVGPLPFLFYVVLVSFGKVDGSADDFTSSMAGPRRARCRPRLLQAVLGGSTSGDNLKGVGKKKGKTGQRIYYEKVGGI